MIIQFGWNELHNIDSTPEAKLILLFCLYINRASPLEKRIATDPYFLAKKLKIDFVPATLITRRFILQSRQGLFSNYVCKEPQSYLTSMKFIHTDAPAQEKVNYLYMLSQRAMNNPNNWIPREYVDEKLLTNRFIYTTTTKIIFLPEKQL